MARREAMPATAVSLKAVPGQAGMAVAFGDFRPEAFARPAAPSGRRVTLVVAAFRDLLDDLGREGLEIARVAAEVWGFVGAKARNAAPAKKGTGEQGDIWLWVATDAESKLVAS